MFSYSSEINFSSLKLREMEFNQIIDKLEGEYSNYLKTKLNLVS